VYSRSKASNSELVSVELVKSFCLPVLQFLLCGVEVADPSKSALTMLNNLISRAVNRIVVTLNRCIDRDVQSLRK